MLLVFLPFALAAKAQYGEITGRVNYNGEGLGKATVVLVDSVGLKAGLGATTDVYGNCTIKPLKPGKYTLEYSCKGYITKTERGIVVNADKAAFIDVRLDRGAKKK